MRNFNPRSREGSDRPLCVRACRSCYFNPRSREGSDPSSQPPPSQARYFNPRSREGSDVEPVVLAPGQQISIHAPVKGATTKVTLRMAACRFQSTLP